MAPSGSRLLKELAKSDGFQEEDVGDMPRASRLQASYIDHGEPDSPSPPRRRVRATGKQKASAEQTAALGTQGTSEEEAMWAKVLGLGQVVDCLIVGRWR